MKNHYCGLHTVIENIRLVPGINCQCARHIIPLLIAHFMPKIGMFSYLEDV